MVLAGLARIRDAAPPKPLPFKPGWLLPVHTIQARLRSVASIPFCNLQQNSKEHSMTQYRVLSYKRMNMPRSRRILMHLNQGMHQCVCKLANLSIDFFISFFMAMFDDATST
jgi:hypothetical protein